MALDLTPASRQAAAYHERFLEESLPEGLRLAVFEAFDPSRYDAEALARGRAAWQLRALDEHRSFAAFADLLALLVQLGAATDLIGTCTRVLRDEDRHVELCRRMVRALGGGDVIPGAPVSTTPRGGALERLLHHVAGSLAVGETFSLMVLVEMKRHTGDALARAVVEQIAADEAVHSAFGWAALRALYPGFDDDTRALVATVVERSRLEAERLVVEAAGRSHPFGSIDASLRARAARRATALVHERMAELGAPLS